MRQRRSNWSTILIILMLLGFAFWRAIPRSTWYHLHPTRETHRASEAESEFTGKVVSVSDGDTISVMHQGREERIRLFGVDSPEMGQAFGSAAKKFTSQMVFGKVVTVSVEDVDRYGRTVGLVVMQDGRVLNTELVRAGMAWWYRRYDPDNHELADLEKQARAAKRGLWADPHAVPPWEFRRQEQNSRY